MKHDEHQEFELLLKKIEWPKPNAELVDMIYARAIKSHLDIIDQAERNPFITLMSLAAATIMGLSFGMAMNSSSQAQAAEFPTANPYALSLSTSYYIQLPNHQE